MFNLLDAVKVKIFYYFAIFLMILTVEFISIDLKIVAIKD